MEIKTEYPYQSQEFNQSWQEWKEYKVEQWKFIYKAKSEKAALTALLIASKGNEKCAICIIQQSIANGWKGFWNLKTEGNGQSKAGSNKPTHQSVNEAFANFYK